MTGDGTTLPLGDLQAALREACGITLSPGIRAILGEALHRAAGAVGVGPEAFLGAIRAREARAVTALVEAAVVGETYFFRHPEQLAALRSAVFDRARADHPLSIWCAGCATGEEAYTLAMISRDAGRAGAGDRILATDVSGRALVVARAGTYGEWSMRRIDPALRARHFEERPPRVAVRAAIREMVEFRRHNLVRDPPPTQGQDLVVCRNVLIYFDAPTASAVVARLFEAVRPGGVLLLGPVETPFAEGLEAERIELDGPILFRRPEKGAAPRKAASRPRGGHASSRALAVPARARSGHAPARKVTPPAPAQRRPPASREIGIPAAVRPGPKEPAAMLDAARDAARRGDLGEAERLARASAAAHLCPESWLLVAAVAEARGELAEAFECVRRALYLDPSLAMGHAALVQLHAREGRPEEAERARRNALAAIEDLDEATPLRGVEPITAGALRSALGHAKGAARRTGAAGRRG